MKTNLILHVGPGKCGSSSIQAFFAQQENPCVQNIRFIILNPVTINALNCSAPDQQAFSDLERTISPHLSKCDVLILSHEYLFQTPAAIQQICKSTSNWVGETKIIGYCRRQSDFLVSAYSQWLFRSPSRVTEINQAIKTLKLDEALFTGLEKQLIASIFNDFYSARQLSEYSIINWQVAYQNIAHHTAPSDALIKCGCLPLPHSNISLVQDFCQKAGLTLHDHLQKASRQTSNLSFNQDLVEALHNATLLELDVPGPHERNDLIAILSAKMTRDSMEFSEFIAALKLYIDAYFLDANKELCASYSLSEGYFAVPKTLSKSDILRRIEQEHQNRLHNPSDIIKQYRNLSAKLAELCIQIAQA